MGMIDPILGMDESMIDWTSTRAVSGGGRAIEDMCASAFQPPETLDGGAAPE